MKERPGWRTRVPAGLGFGVLVGGPAAYGGATLLGHGWAACDIGINASANSFTLLFFVLPFLWVVNTILFGLVFAVVSGSSWRRKVLGALAALATLIVLTWFMFAWFGTADLDPADPSCPAGVPTWWPHWLPSPRWIP